MALCLASLCLGSGWAMLLASVCVYPIHDLGMVPLQLMRLGIFQLAIAKSPSRVAPIFALGGAAALLYGTAHPMWATIGAVVCAASALIAMRAAPILYATIAFGFGLDVIDSEQLVRFAAFDVGSRMIRLASVAALALPFLTLLYDDLVPDAETRLEKLGSLGMRIGAVGMPLILTGAALLSIQLKYLLFIPADATTIGICIASWLAWRRSSLEAIGFGILAFSMIAGLLMGGYAFDGPLPSPVGGYGDLPRVWLREAHVVVMAGGIGLAAWAQARIRGRAAAAKTGASFLGADLDRLNRASLDKSFVPQTDLDWEVPTTDDEYVRLYEVWSLLKGSDKDRGFSDADKATYAKVQQITLMRFTALLERHGMFGIAQLYDQPIPTALAEYLGHFIKEETYHYSMFVKAIERIESTMPGVVPPSAAFDRSLRMIFGLVALVPSARLRLGLTFTMFRFAEQVTIYAHDLVRKTLPRREGLVAQVWARHALDEARHLKFDDMVVERMRLPGIFARLPELLILPACVLMSTLLNANEVWIARRLGAKVGLRHLPGLVKKTAAPFKRRVFGLVGKMLAGPPPLEAAEES
jgi:hypothetical protein